MTNSTLADMKTKADLAKENELKILDDHYTIGKHQKPVEVIKWAKIWNSILKYYF